MIVLQRAGDQRGESLAKGWEPERGSLAKGWEPERESLARGWGPERGIP